MICQRDRRLSGGSLTISSHCTVYCYSTSIVLFGLVLLTLGQTWPTDSTLEAHSGSLITSSFPVKGRVFARAGHSQDRSIVDEPTEVNIVQLGRIFAWVCTVFYLSSRMPQLWKNVRFRFHLIF